MLVVSPTEGGEGGVVAPLHLEETSSVFPGLSRDREAAPFSCFQTNLKTVGPACTLVEPIKEIRLLFQPLKGLSVNFSNFTICFIEIMDLNLTLDKTRKKCIIHIRHLRLVQI